MSSPQEEDQKSQSPSEPGTPRSQVSETKTPRSQAPSQAGSSRHSQAASKQSLTPRSRGRANKIYRAPPTPRSDEMMEKEKSFILDCNAVTSISNDYAKTNPKLGPVIPPYNSQKDRHVRQYFSWLGVGNTLKKTGQFDKSTSIGGPYVDRFALEGKGYMYLSKRNQHGAGHSRDLVDGHSQFMQGIKPLVGYNGKFGYRRNNPWLRTMPSPFGTASTSPTH
jgi:hypothetical protein